MKIRKITSLLLSMSIIFGMINIGTAYAEETTVADEPKPSTDLSISATEYTFSFIEAGYTETETATITVKNETSKALTVDTYISEGFKLTGFLHTGRYLPEGTPFPLGFTYETGLTQKTDGTITIRYYEAGTDGTSYQEITIPISVDVKANNSPDTPSTDLDASNQHPVDENGNGTTKIEITTEPLQMTVTVPVVLPVYFNVKGEATVASNARIVNKSAAPINVTAYNVEAQSGWTFVDTDHDFAKDKAGTKNFSLTVSENVMDEINGHDELPFQYDSKISGQKEPLTNALVGNIIWLIDWVDGEATPEPTYTDFTITAENRGIFGYIDDGRQDLVIPATFTGDDGINYRVVSIGEGAFEEEFALASIVIPDGVKSIGDNAFRYCELDSITIPISVKNIGQGAFEGCPCLASITYDGNTYSSVSEFKTVFTANGNTML